jgi:hypothetical protein
MAFIHVPTNGRAPHVGEPMQITTDANFIFTATCETCRASHVLSIEQAAGGQVQCYGTIILISWPRDARG